MGFVAGMGAVLGRKAGLFNFSPQLPRRAGAILHSKLTTHQQREAIRRRDVDGETLRSIGRSYNPNLPSTRWPRY
jgi:hypothetical protein